MKGNRFLKFIIILFFIAGGYLGYRAYTLVFGKALDLEKEEIAFYIKSGWGSKEVLQALEKEANLKNPKWAERVMEKKNYNGDLVVSGKYTLTDDMSLNTLIDHLRAGNGEEEVNVTFNSARTLEEIAGDVANYIEADSIDLVAAMTSNEMAAKFGFDPTSFKTMFFPDTYRMEWDTDAEEFISRMASEYKTFWTGERKSKARSLGLSQSEVTTLASIVQAEQQLHSEERKTIAGLYLNRLNRGMKLQSDPTVVYALGDFSINRVLTKHLQVDSPYNTYKYAGLPPGPINIPYKQSIDAVLNADEHNYLYMCAKDDFSGYHAFATNLSQHNRNARAFQRALNERGIYR